MEFLILQNYQKSNVVSEFSSNNFTKQCSVSIFLQKLLQMLWTYVEVDVGWNTDVGWDVDLDVRRMWM